MTEHRIKVHLTRLDSGAPYKWRGDCECGWFCLSWQWDTSVNRKVWGLSDREVLDYYGTLEDRGALVMSLQHLDLHNKQ